MDEMMSDILPSRAAKPRILVVDHDKTNLGVLSRRLSEAGFRVIAADGAASAIAELHRGPIDLLLSELYLPGSGGAELARIVRDEIAWRDIPVMMITGRANPEGAVKAYEAGADDVILKPFHFEVLFARVERRLARVRSMRALRGDNAALDARIVARAIELGELRDRLRASEAERLRLQQMVGSSAA